MEPPQVLLLQHQLHLLQKWGVSFAWLVGTLVGKSFEEKQVTLERGDNEPWEGGRGGAAPCFLPLPPCRWRVEQLSGRESIAVQPQNKGAIHWLSYLLRTGILCWQSSPLPRDQ